MSSQHVVRYIILFFFVLGCQSRSKPQVALQNTGFSLENLTENWASHLSNVYDHEPHNALEGREQVALICEQNEGLCEQHTRGPRKKNKLTKDKITLVKNDLNEGDYDELAQYSVEFSLKFFDRYKEHQLLEAADKLLADSSCKTIDMKHALASMLEDYFPSQAPKEKAVALYSQNSACKNSRTGALSAYRAAMLQLLDHNCAAALPHLNRVTTSDEDYLKPRSLYWTWKCQGITNTTKQSPSAPQLPYFSYHRLLIEDEMEKTENQGRQENTPVFLSTNKIPALNQISHVAEKFLSENQPTKARSVLEKVRTERVLETEPEFQVYWAYLLHQSQAGIRKFQILSNLVNRYPQYRSKVVQNMLFPTWYFEHVEASSKTLDPWLVQALIRQESAFDPHARSRVGATGLMQLMPGTARRIARIGSQKLKDPVQNVQVGIKFLEHLVNRFDGQVHLALAAYNAGAGRVDDWLKRYPTDDTMLFVDIIPYRETREYVAFILRNYHWYKSLNVSVNTETKLTSEYKGRFAEQPQAY